MFGQIAQKYAEIVLLRKISSPENLVEKLVFDAMYKVEHSETFAVLHSNIKKKFFFHCLIVHAAVNTKTLWSGSSILVGQLI